MKKRWILLFAVCAVLILTGITVRLYVDRYVWLDEVAVPRDSAQLDLCGNNISVSDFERLQTELPECQIIWDVPFQGGTYRSTTKELCVSSLTETDVDMLRYFPELTYLDARGCTDYAQLQAFQVLRPECAVRYQVELSGMAIENDADQAVLTNPDAQELEERLPYLPALTQLALTGQLPDMEDLLHLQHAFPQISFQWEIPFQDLLLTSETNELDLSGRNVDYEETLALFRWLPEMKTVNMRECGLTDQEMMMLADTYPNCFFVWDMTVGEQKIATDVEMMDISGQLLERAEEIEAILPYFRNLSKVVMSHCGLDDETMDALNKRYENIRFIWSVRINYAYVRTDALFFYPLTIGPKFAVDNEDLYPLRYCTDMIAIDIGHMRRVTDCEWAAFMPNLKYLILGDTAVTDLTPLNGLKKLAYLEIWDTKITDYSPLLGCTGLEDLNMSKTYGDHTPIMQMTWLKHLWWGCIIGRKGLPCSTAPQDLPEALPNTEIKFELLTFVSENGWRKLQNYYDMRDIMGVPYLR